MFPAHPLYRIGAASAAAVLASFTLAGHAAADQPTDRGKTGAAHSHTKADKGEPGTRGKAHGKTKDKPDDKGAPGTRGNGHGKDSGGKGKGTGNGKGGNPDKPKGGGEKGDPAGNNGTVKIAGPGDVPGHPSNNPHPGCEFLVEWYGFDAGADVISTVTFASHAPTADTVLGGTDPATVFVGEDAAGGGTDLDGSQAYALTFDGAPHPQQGYHVKLTVATPHSNGNDTKSKVFWVEPCETDVPVAPEETEGDEPAGDAPQDAPETEPAPDEAETDEDAPLDVLGVFATADKNDEGPEVAGMEAQAGDDDQAAVPTAVDAGEGSDGLGGAAWVKGPVPLTLLGLAAVGGGALYWRRSRNRT